MIQVFEIQNFSETFSDLVFPLCKEQNESKNMRFTKDIPTEWMPVVDKAKSVLEQKFVELTNLQRSCFDLFTAFVSVGKDYFMETHYDDKCFLMSGLFYFHSSNPNSGGLSFFESQSKEQIAEDSGKKILQIYPEKNKLVYWINNKESYHKPDTVIGLRQTVYFGLMHPEIFAW